MRLVRLASFLAATALLPAAARAGGYDTPMLYSARHMGMGGTAIGSVDDPSALFHNPAGLAQTEHLSLTADFSLLLAHVHASPSGLAPDVDSKQTVAPLFLLGAGYRLTPWMAVGLGVFPIASAGATYSYPVGMTTVENRTRLVFLEATPAVAFNLPGRVRLGAGYRVTYVSLERYLGVPADPSMMPGLDFSMSGINWAGFRVGAQWSATNWLQVGAVYRHRISTRITNDHGTAILPFGAIDTTFVLPAKLGGGARADFGPVGVAVDGEYLFNSQNHGYALEGTTLATAQSPMPMMVQAPNVFDWKNEITVRSGVEYRLLRTPEVERGRLALRLGYVFDGTTTNPHYPSAFGTPPGPTHVFTAGAGWRARRWQLNAAFARRQGSGNVTEADVSSAPKPCQFCSAAGKDPYRIGINGFYLDLGYHF
jgi:long-chain fatty acid transport protein